MQGAWIGIFLSCVTALVAVTQPATQSAAPQLFGCKLHLPERVSEAVPLTPLLELTNNGDAAVKTYVAGPDATLDAQAFEVVITYPTGKTESRSLANGKHQQGLLLPVTIPAGSAVEVPAYLGRLPTGHYKLTFQPRRDRANEWLRIRRWPRIEPTTVEVDVVGDEKLRDMWVDEQVAALRKGNAFAAFLAHQPDGTPILNALIEELQSKDERRVAQAAMMLWQNHFPRGKLPLSVQSALNSAMGYRADHPPATRPRWGENAGYALGLVAQHYNRGQMDSILLRLTNDPDGDTRESARMALSREARARLDSVPTTRPAASQPAKP
jgi:hypothetical protein